MLALQQCDNCQLISQSNRWPTTEDGFMYCPVCHHDESSFLDLPNVDSLALFFAHVSLAFSRDRRELLAWEAREGMGPYDPLYISKLDS